MTSPEARRPFGRGARLLAVADHRPGAGRTNEELEEASTVAPGWVLERTGIRARLQAADGESIASMASMAAGKALAASGTDPEEVDLVIVATSTRRRPVPGVAPTVATMLGARRAGAYDLNAVCAGFAYALAAAADSVRSGSAERVVVVGSERVTDWVDPSDIGTSSIFADGAGAAVVGEAEENGIGPVIWGSDGSRANAIEVPDDALYIQMNGQAVFRWAVTKMVGAAERACAAVGMAPSELAAFVPHQANLRIVEALAQSLGVDRSRVADDIIETGNTSAASIPMALASLIRSGRVAPGEPVLLLGFGSGLTYAGQVVRCP